MVLDVELSKTEDDDDCFPVPTPILTYNHQVRIFKHKRLTSLSYIIIFITIIPFYSHSLSCSWVSQPAFFLALDLNLENPWMAGFRSQAQIWASFVCLCILNLALVFKTGFAAESACKTTNYQSFLPPPYQNISSMLCRPVWNTYELRVSTYFILHWISDIWLWGQIFLSVNTE